MKAWIVEQWCEPREMSFKDLPDPVPGPEQVVVEVRAAGINFPDMLLIQGKYQQRPPRPFTPGAEVAGVVTAVGSGVTTLKAGQRVMALCFIGGYAEKVVIAAKDAYVMPDQMTFEEGAGFNITYQSSYFGVVVRGKLQKEETLLVHAGAGGIGTSAIQIGKAIGAKVYATVGSDEKMEIARQAGADLIFNYKDPTWSKKIRKEHGGADVVIDPVGGEIFDKSVLCTNFEGRIIVVGFTSGKIPQLATNFLLLNNISVLGLYWNLYYTNHPMRIQAALADLFAWYAEGKIKPVIFKTCPLGEAPQALEEIASRNTFGKVILIP